MKRLIFAFVFGFVGTLHGQTYQALEKTLAKELPENSSEDGRWVFHSNNAAIRKVDKPAVKALLPNFEFYEVTLTNYLGYHVNRGTCSILFDSTKSKIVLVEPLWYSGTSQPLVKMVIGKRIGNKDSLIIVLNELHELMQIGSVYKFRQTSFSDSVATYDLGYFKGDSYTTGSPGVTSTINYNENGVWRKIIVEIKDGAIFRYTEINPKTNSKEIIE